jgi:hypothetical protein
MRFENKEFSEFKVWEGRKDFLHLRLRILRLSYKFFAWTGIMEFGVDIDACYNSGSKIDTREMGNGCGPGSCPIWLRWYGEKQMAT